MSVSNLKKQIDSNRPEKELHVDLKKLFPKMDGIDAWEYTHGNAEKGADFVLQKRHDVFGTIQYVGVVVKKGGLTQANIYDVERQIDECDAKRKFQNGKKEIHLDEIWVIVPGSISSPAKDRIHDKFKAKSVQFIDGKMLVDLIDKFLPSYWSEVPFEIAEYMDEVKRRNRRQDTQLSLLGVGALDFYIEQDVFLRQNRFRSRDIRRSRSKKVDVPKQIAKEKLLLIEGGMGAGKSKLVRHLVDHYAEPLTFREIKTLPVICSYNDYVGKYDSSLNQLLADQLKQIPDPSQFKKIVFIDGFDEKNLTSEEQLEHLSALAQAALEMEDIKLVLTSRYLGGLENTSEISRRFARLELRPLSFGKTLEFLNEICSRLNVRTRIIEDLRKSPLFREIPKSPIAAIILARLLNESDQEIPSSMTELYAKFTELALGRWDVSKNFQTEKEYEVLQTVMMMIASSMMENSRQTLSLDEVKEFFDNYLEARNLNVKADTLFQKLKERCSLVDISERDNIFAFKHRTFMEFLHAKHMKEQGSLKIDDRAFDLYWVNTFFFFLGLKKDSSNFLSMLIDAKPENELHRWVKSINMPNYFLAAYSTRYDVISLGIEQSILETARLYLDTVEGRSTSPFVNLPRMHVFYLLSSIIAENYSYEFFSPALETAALNISSGNYDEAEKLYSLCLLTLADLELEGENNLFTKLLDRSPQSVPIDISLLLRDELEDKKTGNVIVKRYRKKYLKMLKGNQNLRNYIAEIHEKPIKLLTTGNED